MKIINLSILSLVLVINGCGSSTPSKKMDSEKEDKTTGLAELDFLGEYTLTNTEFGTKTSVSIRNGKRVMKSNGLPNHRTGAFPNEGNPNTIAAQELEYIFPVNPKFSGESKWTREPGVALNGVKFEPETAERFVCESGEVYRIEAFQTLVNLGLDFNHAHVQPTGAYHYHGVPTGLVKALDKGEDVILVGFATDGFPIYYSKQGRYKPSYQVREDSRTGDVCAYTNPTTSMKKELKGTKPDGTFVSDWEYVEGLGELDECNGITIDGKYAYFVTAEYPYMGRCLKGEFTSKRPQGPPPGRHPHGARPPRH